MSLTNNAIATLIKNQTHANDSSFFPILQVLKVLPVNNSQGTSAERYRVILSDGIHLAQGMFATQHNHRIRDKEVVDLSFLRISDYMTNVVQGKSLIIVLGFEIVTPHPGRKIGNPVDIGKANAGGGGAMPQARNQPIYGAGAVKAEKTYSNPYANNNAARNNSNPYAQASASAPIIRTQNASSTPITPIANLNMYQNRWTIKARITSKGEIRHWSNSKGDGSLFSIDPLDSLGTDIRTTFFKEAVDKFHPILTVDKVYTCSGGRLKTANATYNTCASPFEVTFDQNSEIHEEQDTGEIMQQNYEFCPIVQLETIDPGKFVDVVGVVKAVAEPSTIVSKKSGKEMTKCELVLGDDSGGEVNCTVWGERANGAVQEFANNPVVALRSTGCL